MASEPLVPVPGGHEEFFLALLQEGEECEKDYGEDEEGIMKYKIDEEGAAEDCYWTVARMLGFLQEHKVVLGAHMRALDKTHERSMT